MPYLLSDFAFARLTLVNNIFMRSFAFAAIQSSAFCGFVMQYFKATVWVTQGTENAFKHLLKRSNAKHF